MALASLRPLRSRNFALIWSAALVSNVGSWMQTVALGILVFARTGQPGWAGLVAAAAFVPIGLLAPLGGVLADRLDRRKWLIVTTFAEMLFAAVLTVLAAVGHDPPFALVVLAFLGGASSAIGFPSYQAMVPDLVPEEDLLGAVSLSSAQFNLGRVVGPALAGLALLSHDYAVVFGINTASFAAVVVALLLVRLPPPVETQGAPGLVQRIVIGVRTAMSEPGCRSAIGLIALVALLASPFIALVPAMAGALERGGMSTQEATAVLVTAQGVGAVCGAVALPTLAERAGRLTMLRTALFLLPFLLVAYGLARQPLVVGADLRRRGRRLHRGALGPQHGRADPRAGGCPGQGAQHLHDGARHRLPDRCRRPGLDRGPGRREGGHRRRRGPAARGPRRARPPAAGRVHLAR